MKRLMLVSLMSAMLVGQVVCGDDNAKNSGINFNQSAIMGLKTAWTGACLYAASQIYDNFQRWNGVEASMNQFLNTIKKPVLRKLWERVEILHFENEANRKLVQGTLAAGACAFAAGFIGRTAYDYWNREAKKA